MFNVILVRDNRPGIVMTGLATAEDATLWGFAHLPSKPTDPPWWVEDANGRTPRMPCTGAVLDALVQAWS